MNDPQSLNSVAICMEYTLRQRLIFAQLGYADQP